MASSLIKDKGNCTLFTCLFTVYRTTLQVTEALWRRKLDFKELNWEGMEWINMAEVIGQVGK
jgi:hypothetical protein